MTMHSAIRQRAILVAILILVLSAALGASGEHNDPTDKVDDGLGAPDRMYPVFVRMTDQLFCGAGDYEEFCQAHEHDKRRELRTVVIRTLRDKSDKSWEDLRRSVERLERNGAIKSVRRYWIVNGFACEATGAAVKELAADDAVSFVYRQRIPITPALHFRPVPISAAPSEAQKTIYEEVLEEWKDDSDDPVTTDGFNVPWNVQRVKAHEAWKAEQATGSGVVVALCDSGLMVTPSLTAALWKNPDEQLNGKDDDGNGYVDDLFGFDFNAQSWYALGDGPRMTHGSMCGGIIAGRPLNKEKLITGVAPRARLMVLRGMGLLESYEYALLEGADVMSMSYMFISAPLGNYRGLYRLAHEHLAAGGIVAVGGAGNFSRNKPRGQQIAVPKDIPCVIAAAGILEDGSQAPASSEGPCFWNGVRFYDDYGPDQPLPKPDVTGCFGGYPVWGRPSLAKRLPQWTLVTDEGSDIGLVVGPQGNSFSGPHAAGVAALMLSVNPDLKAWQIKALIEQTCEDLGEKGRDDKFGAGLLDALAAVRAAKD